MRATTADSKILLVKDITEKEKDPVIVNEVFGDEERDDNDEDGESENSQEFRSGHLQIVVLFQRTFRIGMDTVQEVFQGQFFKAVLLVAYCGYFTYAMYHRFGDEGSYRLLGCTVLGVVLAARHKALALLTVSPLYRWWRRPKTEAFRQRVETAQFFGRWLLYGALAAFIGNAIADVAIREPHKLTSLSGMIVIVLVCFLFSTAPSQINWHTIYISLGQQFIIAYVMLRWSTGKEILIWIQDRLNGFYANTHEPSLFIFGRTYEEHKLVFGIMPMLFFTNAVLSVLYHVGVMQFLIRNIGSGLSRLLGTTIVESYGVSASIFLEMFSALLCLRPYLAKLSTSELFCLCVAMLSSLGSTFLAVLAMLKVEVKDLVPAMLLSAPANFTVCKLLVPMRKRRGPEQKLDLPEEMRCSGVLEAAQKGALAVVPLIVNAMASCFSFLSLLALLDVLLVWFGDRVGLEDFTMEKIFSYLFYPVAILMGVDTGDCGNVGSMLGTRLVSTNFLAFFRLTKLTANRGRYEQFMQTYPNGTLTYAGSDIILKELNTTLPYGFISRRSETITVYSLCGLSSLMSTFLMMGIMPTMVPKREKWFLANSIKFVVAGNLANCLVGCFAGLLL